MVVTAGGSAHEQRAGNAPEEIGEQAGRAVQDAAERALSGGGDAPGRAVELLGRFGLVAYGAVHLLVAGLGVRLAFGARGAEVDQRGAIAAVASVGPVGTAVLVTFVAGLGAFAVWQVSAAVAGFRWVSGAERRRKRVGAAAKAVAVVAVAVVAARFVVESPGGPGRTGPAWLVGSLLEIPGGRWLVAAVAVFVLVVAATMVYTGVARTFLGDLVDDVPPRVLRAAAVLGATGNLARAVAFGAVGVLFADAALHADPDRVGGLNEALRGLEGQWQGVAPLLVLSAGLAAFGGYCLIDCRYRRA
ncbi:DUF1206 domain-containing protein [Pseudonocardia sp. KRD291]|uniref:DUF1206 domain-containing protein n=1 Tax=Pseudonocardia sp. KRD291 TaxID=2792007 RepID=UPI001C4A16D3|nr:DUF1206 domain-containing protein [Pseudonocardia sp. KRD291]MBW0102644.1 DUF1206 domain-containing protein [Pseudonocardia sp. KRD291]